MRRISAFIISMGLCLSLTAASSAEGVLYETTQAPEENEPVVFTAAEEPVVMTEISVADDYSYEGEGGLVPTYIDNTIQPEFTLPEEGKSETPSFVATDSEIFGADGIVPAEREEGVFFADMSELYFYWHSSGKYEYTYPDYVCGIWTETGDMSELVVAVTKDEAGEAGKEEILSLIENDASVRFTYQSYPYHELKRVQDEITSYMGDTSGIYGVGVYEMDNKVHIDINMSNSEAENYVKKLTAHYGDKIVFEAGSGIILDSASAAITYDGAIPATGVTETGAIVYGGVSENGMDNFWIFAVCGAVVIFAVTVLLVLHRARLRQTVTGAYSEKTARLTRKNTEKLIAEATEIPSEDILKKLKEEIEK